jgi:predicted dehydrogenase
MEGTFSPVSWGILSTADIGLKRVIPAMMKSKLSRVDAIASRSEAPARAAAEMLGIPRYHPSYQELLEDPDIEAIYIPLPNHLHLEWAIAAAEAGKHVLCEKPLALSTSDVRAMIDACNDAGVLLMEAFMYRLHPLWAEVLQVISAGEIGEVRAINIAFSYFNDDPNNIRNIPAFGGGTLYDIGCYAVNVSRLVLGSEPSEVKALIARDERFETDVMTSAVLDFDGRHATFYCSTQAEPDQRVGIYGTRGRIVVEIPFNIPPDRPARFLRIAGGDPPDAPGVEVHEIPPADSYLIQADLFSTAIRTGAPVPIDPEDSLANLKVIEQIFGAAGVQ